VVWRHQTPIIIIRNARMAHGADIAAPYVGVILLAQKKLTLTQRGA